MKGQQSLQDSFQKSEDCIRPCIVHSDELCLGSFHRIATRVLPEIFCKKTVTFCSLGSVYHNLGLPEIVLWMKVIYSDEFCSLAHRIATREYKTILTFPGNDVTMDPLDWNRFQALIRKVSQDPLKKLPRTCPV